MSTGKRSHESAGWRPLRILHVVPSYLPATRYGGPIYSVHGLCKALSRAGHDVHVFTTNVDGERDSDVPLAQPVDRDGVKIWYFPSRILRRLFFAPGMARALKSQLAAFDLVHLHSVFLWPTLAAARAARKAGIPYLLAPRGMLNPALIGRKSTWKKKGWIRLFERSNLEHASAVHVTSEIEGKELQKLGFDLPRTIFVPNGIDMKEVEAFSGRIEARGNEVFALFLGRINWKKGLDRLLEAWRLVPATRLLVAGNDEEGYRPELERLAQECGVAGRVQFVGPVAGVEKWQLLQAAALFILPSYSENFGMAVLEAMAAGCPVAVTPEVGLAATVTREACGIVIDGSAEAMAASITALLRDGDARARMGAKGREVARKQFGWDAIAKAMHQAYLEVLSDQFSARQVAVS